MSQRTLSLFALLVFAAGAAGAIPGAADPDAYTARQFSAALHEFNQRTMVEMYRVVGHRDAKWDGEAIQLLEALSHVFSFPADAMPDGRTANDLLADVAKLGKTARDAGCDDPLVIYSYGAALSELGRPADRARPLIERGAAGLYTSRYPLNRAMAAAHRECLLLPATASAEQREAAWVRYKDLALSTVAAWPWQGTDRRFILNQIWHALEAQGFERQKDFAAALAGQGGADPWVSSVIRGRCEMNAAHRGAGGGGELQRARAHLEAAWKLEPTYPEPAKDLIRLSMWTGTRSKNEMRLWFDRAVTAQFDYAEAYTAYLHGLYPGWHGSHEAMYEFGRECADTKRYDTSVPYQLVNALEMIANDARDPQCWQRPGVYEEVRAVLEGMAKHETLARKADRHRSYLAAIAWRANQFDEARTRIEALGPQFQPDAFKWLNVMPPLALSHVYAMGPPTRERVTRAEQQAAAGQLEAAAKSYEEALSAVGAEDKAALFLRGRAKQLQWERQFATGGWVDIQPDAQLSGWTASYGEWRVDEAGGLVGSYTPEGLMLLCQAAFLGKDFILEGDAELQEFSCDAGIGISPGTPTHYYGIWLRQRKARKSVARDLVGVVQDDVALKPVNRFRFTFEGGKVSGHVNGDEVFSGTDVAYVFPTATTKTYIGVGGRWGQKGSRVRFTALRVKRLNGDGE